MKKFKLNEVQKSELYNIYKDFISRHENEIIDKEIILKDDDNECYIVTLNSCVDVCKNMIRIPTEYYCGVKVVPRSIELISEYSYYEKLCLKEILKEYDTESSKFISDYLYKE